MDSVTALTVVYNTPDITIKCLDALRKFYPDIRLILVDNSDQPPHVKKIKEYIENDKNHLYIKTPFNLGHGPGLNRGAHHIVSDCMYVFDSDAEIIRPNFLEDMFSFMDEDVYGVGYCMPVNSQGLSFAKDAKIKYLHPLGCLISVKMFRMYAPFVSGGAPFIETMHDIDRTGNSENMLIHFPVHLPIPDDPRKAYVKHYSGATRILYKGRLPSKYKGY